MTYSDDDLDRLFRAADPAPLTAGDSRPSAADIAVRESILRGSPRSPRPRRTRALWTGMATATIAVAVTAIVAVDILSPAQRALAFPPPPLQYRAAPALADVIESATARLTELPDVAQRSSVRSIVWGWSVDMAEKRVEIVPQDITFRWAPGETATTTTVAADPAWVDDLPAGVDPSPYEPGEVIDTVIIPPEDFALPAEVRNLGGSAPSEVEAALAAFGVSPQSSSGELLAAITGLLQYWTLDDAQHATLLDLLARADGVTVRGETTDRLGRDVIGLQVSSVVPERVETVLVSASTGRIVGMESELIAPLDGLPTGVISYTMWDVDGR